MHVLTPLFGIHPARLCHDSGQDVQNADNPLPPEDGLIPTAFVFVVIYLQPSRGDSAPVWPGIFPSAWWLPTQSKEDHFFNAKIKFFLITHNLQPASEIT